MTSRLWLTGPVDLLNFGRNLTAGSEVCPLLERRLLAFLRECNTVRRGRAFSCERGDLVNAKRKTVSEVACGEVRHTEALLLDRF